MTWWRVGSRPATAARSATVLPAPTSPVITPSVASATQKLIRATARRGPGGRTGPWRRSACRTGCAPARSGQPRAPGSWLALLAGGGEQAQLREVDLRAGAGLLIVGGGHQAQVVDTGGGRLRPGGLGNGPVDVAAGDERGGGPGGLAVEEHLDGR